MKTCIKCNETKAVSDFNKDRQKRDGMSSVCRLCDKKKGKKWYGANKDTKDASNKAWNDANKEQHAASTAQWAAANPLLRAANAGLAYAVKQGSCASGMYDRALCIPFYEEARRLTIETGIKYEVDHIIPVSKGGLHCQTNLQVMTQKDNLNKRITDAI